jgi:molecular chaperone GrpE
MSKKDEKNIKNEDSGKQEERVDKKAEELEQLKKRIEDAENNYKRALADYQNLQKRVADERREMVLSSNKDLLLRILSVLDTLMLANKHEESETLKVCINQFLDTLKSEGVTKIQTDGAEFDPRLMEAIATDVGEDGKVLEELKVGYILNDKVLRPAQVKVGKS